MKKLQFKWSFDELNAIAEGIKLAINTSGTISVNELLVRTIMLECLIRLRNKLVWKYAGKKSNKLSLVEAIAFSQLLGKITLDRFTPYQSAVILPVLEVIDKEIFRHKHPVG